ncbi:zinc-binding dehydrogenase [Xenorhabdus budapestensis]|uniref:Zinc-binding dehydrogenase n=1 Tax=Xenorhabdus budapestensis TaxID=290110 RepID=A0A2D0J0H9_XENBU|nr:zinc-binding dehydrogenase [Xenorhabdus budapestensis]
MIVDLIAGEYVAKNFQAAAVEGRIAQIGLLDGKVRELNLSPLMQKRLTLTGSMLRPRSIEDKAFIAHDLYKKVWPLLEQGRIRPQIFKIFPLEQAAEAHTLMESGKHIGKIMLII